MGATPTTESTTTTTSSTTDDVTELVPCSTCSYLRKKYPTFTVRGITNSICSSLMMGKGFSASDDVNTCDDLKAANNCLIQGLHEKLPMYDDCDWKCYAEQLTRNQEIMNEAIICAICGLQEQVNNFYSNFWSVDVKYVIAQATDGLSLTIDRQGYFKYHHDDWYAKEHVGSGDLTGKIDFCMGLSDNKSVMWRIDKVNLYKYEYKKIRTNSPNSVTVRIPDASSSIVYTHTLGSSFTDNINKSVTFSKAGTLEVGASSGWITFAHMFTDWDEDDEALFQIQFSNNTKGAVPSC